MQQMSVRSESLAAQVSTLELTLQKREAELTRSHSELDVVKKENQVSSLFSPDSHGCLKWS